MSKTDPNVQNLKRISSEQQFSGEQAGQTAQQFIQDYLTGTLPPGQDASIKLLLDNLRAGTHGTYARLGLPGSTMEQSALDYDQLQAEALKAEILKSIAGLGIQEQGVSQGFLSGSAGTLNDIISAQAKTDAATTGAIGQFAGALGKGGAFSPGAGSLGSVGGLFAASDPTMAGTGLAGSSWGIDLGALFGGGGDAAAAAAAAAAAV